MHSSIIRGVFGFAHLGGLNLIVQPVVLLPRVHTKPLSGCAAGCWQSVAIAENSPWGPDIGGDRSDKSQDVPHTHTYIYVYIILHLHAYIYISE
jgi:hypothetical protein